MATFFVLAAKCGVATAAEIASWADQIIDRSPKPPRWAVDLSLSANRHAHELVALLHEVPGESTQWLAGALLCGRMSRLFASGVVRGGEVARLLESIALEAIFSNETRWEIHFMEDNYGLIAEGYCTEAQADDQVRQFLEQFTEYDRVFSQAAL